MTVRAGFVAFLLLLCWPMAPRALVGVAHLDSGTLTNDLLVADELAYVSDGLEGVRVFDVSKPWRPVELGHWPIQGVEFLALGESVLFATLGAGIVAIDVSDPAQPVELVRFAPGVNFGAMAVEDGVLYAAEAGLLPYTRPFRRVFRFEVGDPRSPRELPVVQSASRRPLSIATGSGLLAVCSDITELFDVDGPLPRRLHAFSGSSVDDVCNDAAIENGRLFWTSDLRFRIFDLSDPEDPIAVGESAGPGRELAIDIDEAFVMGPDAVVKLSISDPTQPVPTSSLEIEGRRLELGEHHLFVLEGAMGVRRGRKNVRVVDRLDSSPAREIYAVRRRYGAVDLLREGDRLYALDRTELDVLDISDPTAPVSLGAEVTGTGRDGQLARAGSLAVAAGDQRFVVLEVTGPDTPQKLSEILLEGIRAHGVAVQDGQAYVPGFRTMQVFDFTDPRAPHLVTAPELPYSAVRLALRGRVGWLIAGPGLPGQSSSLRALDLRDPTTLPDLGVVELPDYVRNLVVRGDHAYVANDPNGFQILDVADPSAPEVIGSLALASTNPDGGTRDVALSGRFAYLAEWHYGVRVVDVSDPMHPVELARVAADALKASGDGGRPSAVTAEHGVAITSDFNDVLRIIDFRPVLEAGLILELDRIDKSSSPRGNRIFRAVLLGSDELSGSEIEPASVRLGSDERSPLPARPRIGDWNGDGIQDWSTLFRITGSDGRSTGTLCLSGHSFDRRAFEVCGAME